MTLQQGIELAQMAKAKGYVLATDNGKVQFQVLNANGDVELEITDWVDYDEAKELMAEGDE